MRHRPPLACAILLLTAGAATAQPLRPLGPPTVVITTEPAPPPTFIPVVQTGPALGPPPTPAGPAPALMAPPQVYPSPSPFPPPPGLYPPPPPLLRGEPARNPSVWVGVEALLWWSKNQPLSVPLITTGPASQGAAAGNLDSAGTSSLDRSLHYGATGGFRVFAGGWLDAGHTVGVDASVFFLSRQSAGFGAFDRSGTGSVVINEPVAGAPFVTQASAPGYDTGGVSVNASSRLVGGDANLLYNLYRGGGWTLNLVGGYRYLELSETLDVTAASQMFVATQYTDGLGNVVASAPIGSTILVFDHFGTRNQFNGGQLGASFEYLQNRWSLNGSVKVALGSVHEVVTIDGSTIVTPPGGTPTVLTGGNYASVQLGRFSQDRLAVVPELQLGVGYQVTPWLRATVGYQFLYLSSALRPGNQIDNTYDGVTHPLVPMHSSGYWAQGLNLGLQFRY